MRPDLTRIVDAHHEDMVRFAQKLIQTPSLPGQEQQLADLVQSELERLGYDRVRRDEVGNVIGLMRGAGGGHSLMLNSHMDHVDVGDVSQWPHPPYEGAIAGGFIWGLAACDVKCSLAVQLYAAAMARQAKLRQAGDVYFAAVVLEEKGGWGTEHLVKHLKTDSAILSEATNNEIRIGHRGRLELQALFRGRSAHASAPTRGANPHYAMAKFLSHLREVRMTSDAVFGQSTVAPSLVFSDQHFSNVTPGELRLLLDWRNVPSETTEQILAKLQRLLDTHAEPGIQSKISVNQSQLRTYTDLSEWRDVIHLGYALPATHPLIVTARQTLQTALEREVEVSSWTFATDGGHLSAAGIPALGFAPGDESRAHTIHDRVALAQMREAAVGYLALIENLCD